MNKFIVLPYERFQALTKIHNKPELVQDKEAIDERPQLVDQTGLGNEPPPPPPPPQYRHLLKKKKRLSKKLSKSTPKNNWVVY
jgi:hypothetical protein